MVLTNKIMHIQKLELYFNFPLLQTVNKSREKYIQWNTSILNILVKREKDACRCMIFIISFKTAWYYYVWYHRYYGEYREFIFSNKNDHDSLVRLSDENRTLVTSTKRESSNWPISISSLLSASSRFFKGILRCFNSRNIVVTKNYSINFWISVIFI